MDNQKPILVGWKEIATYIGVSPATAQRLYREANLPVRVEGRAYASARSLQEWCVGQCEVHYVSLDEL